jgi:hypothetical protein
MGDFKDSLPSDEFDEPRRAAELDGYFTIRIQMQNGIIRQAMSQLLAVSRRQVQHCRTTGRNYRGGGLPVPPEQQTDTQYHARGQRGGGSLPAA